MAGTGLGFLLGVKNTNLVQILWFLILGLGVDDAFVLVAEFNRVSTQKVRQIILYLGEKGTFFGRLCVVHVVPPVDSCIW